MIHAVRMEQPTPPHGLTPKKTACSPPSTIQQQGARHATHYSLAHTQRIDSVLLQVFVQATEGLLSTTRFAATRLGQQKHAPTSFENAALGGADVGPSTNDDGRPDPYGDGASETPLEKEGIGSGRRSSNHGDTTAGRGDSRGWVLTTIDSHTAASSKLVVRHLVLVQYNSSVLRLGQQLPKNKLDVPHDGSHSSTHISNPRIFPVLFFCCCCQGQGVNNNAF